MSTKLQDYLLNKIFTVPYLDRMICDHDTNMFLETYYSIMTQEFDTYGQGIKDLYDYMNQSYRNEYYFKNTILNKLLINNHDIYTTAAFTELPLAGSKADFVMINGRGVVYEIKTDLDNFDRLGSQLMDYYKVFPYVNVVVGYHNFHPIRELLKDSPVGIYVLYDSGNLLCRKKAEYYDKTMEYKAMFEVLRKKEFEKIILKHMHKLPDVNSFYYYRECLKWIQMLNIKTFYNDILVCLKERQLSTSRTHTVEDVPYELRTYAYFTQKSNNEMINCFCEERMEN